MIHKNYLFKFHFSSFIVLYNMKNAGMKEMEKKINPKAFSGHTNGEENRGNYLLTVINQGFRSIKMSC